MTTNAQAKKVHLVLCDGMGSRCKGLSEELRARDNLWAGNLKPVSFWSGKGTERNLGTGNFKDKEGKLMSDFAPLA